MADELLNCYPCSAAGDAVPGAHGAAVCRQHQPAQQQVRFPATGAHDVCSAEAGSAVSVLCTQLAGCDACTAVSLRVLRLPNLCFHCCSYVLKTQALVLTGYGAANLQLCPSNHLFSVSML